MKFTIGRPKPRFAKPLPVIVKLAGGVARSIELGVMPHIRRAHGWTATTGEALTTTFNFGTLPVCCQTWASTGPADSPGRFGVIDVAGVGKGTVSVVPARAVARACASSGVPRRKFTIGRPKPRVATPLPALVMLAGGGGRAVDLGGV